MNAIQLKQPLKFASFLGDNAFEFYRQVVGWLAQTTGLPAELVRGPAADELDRQVNAGQIQAVFTCGLSYTRKADASPPLLRLLAAPVMAAPRYRNRPVYFSDVIVRADAPQRTLVDLRGKTFAFNEVHSLSGHWLPCYHLWRLGYPFPFFGQVVRSGDHAVSMDWVEAGRVTSAAIDSVVLEMEVTQRPHRADAFCVIESIGPFPMPPVAASPGLSGADERQLRSALLAMHTSPTGAEILRQAGMRRFAPVEDADYHPIRAAMSALRQVGITELQ